MPILSYAQISIGNGGAVEVGANIIASGCGELSPCTILEGGSGSTTAQGAATNIVDGNAINPSSIGQVGTAGPAKFSTMSATSATLTALTNISCLGTSSTGQIQAGTCSAGSLTSFAAPSISWPTWLVPTVTNATSAPSLAVTAGLIPNSALVYNSTTVNGQSCTLGGSCTISAGTNPTGTGIPWWNGSSWNASYSSTSSTFGKPIGMMSDGTSLAPQQVWSADLFPSAGCTVNSVVYNTNLTCAIATANAYTMTTHIAPAVEMGWGPYKTDISLVLQCFGNYSYQCTGLRGKSMYGTGIVPLNSGVHVAAPMIQVVGTTPNTSAIAMSDFGLSPNYQFAGCFTLDGVALNTVDNIQCGKSGNSLGYNGSNATPNTMCAFCVGATSGLSAGDFAMHNILYVNGGHHGTGLVALASISSGAITGYTIMQSVSNVAFAAGSGGTNGTYTIAATGGTCNLEPSVTVTVSGGAIVSATLAPATNNWSNAGLCSAGTPTISLASIAGLSGAAVTLTMSNTGTSTYDSAYSWKPVYTGHSAGALACSTKPTNLPVLTYSGSTSGSVTAIGLTDGTTASTGAGCVAPVFLQLATGDPIDYAFDINVPDSKFDFMRTGGGGQIAGFNMTSGGSTFWHLHPYDLPLGIIDRGGTNTYFGTEIDSPWDTGFLITNGTKAIHGSIFIWDANGPYPGTSEIAFGSGAGGMQTITGGGCADLPADIADFHAKVGANGPIETGAGVYPGNTEDTDANCNGEIQHPSNAYHGRYLSGPLSTGLSEAPLRSSNATVTTVKGIHNFGYYKYINASNPSSYQSWLSTVDPADGSLSFQPPWNDVTLNGQVANGNPSSMFGFKLASVGNATAGNNYCMQPWYFETSVWNGSSPVYPITLFAACPVANSGTNTAINLDWYVFNDVMTRTMKMPWQLDAAAIQTPGISIAGVLPPTFTITPVVGTGTLAAGTYYYKDASASVFGTGIWSSEEACVLPAPGQCKIFFPGSPHSQPGAQSIVLSRSSTSGAELLLPTVYLPASAGNYSDNGSLTPSGALNTWDQSIPPTTYQPVTQDPFIFHGKTTAVTQTTIYTPLVTAAYRLSGAINCDAVSAGATATLEIGWVDSSGTDQFQSARVACTVLGPSSVGSINMVVQATAPNSIAANVTIEGSPTFSVSAVVEQLSQH